MDFCLEAEAVMAGHKVAEPDVEVFSPDGSEGVRNFTASTSLTEANKKLANKLLVHGFFWQSIKN